MLEEAPSPRYHVTLVLNLLVISNFKKAKFLQLPVDLALDLAGLLAGLTLELGSLALSLAESLVGLALGLGCGVGGGLLDGLSDLLCNEVLEMVLSRNDAEAGRGRFEPKASSDLHIKASDYLPPFSIPFTAAPEIVLSTALAASLMVSTGPLRAMGVVENRRAWRAIWERNIVM